MSVKGVDRQLGQSVLDIDFGRGGRSSYIVVFFFLLLNGTLLLLFLRDAFDVVGEKLVKGWDFSLATISDAVTKVAVVKQLQSRITGNVLLGTQVRIDRTVDLSDRDKVSLLLVVVFFREFVPNW